MTWLYSPPNIPEWSPNQMRETPIADELREAARVMGVDVPEGEMTFNDGLLLQAKIVRAMAEQFTELAKASGEFALEAANALKALHGQ